MEPSKLLHDIRNLALGYQLDYEAVIPFGTRDTLLRLTNSYVSAIGGLQSVDGQLWAPIEALVRNAESAARKLHPDFSVQLPAANNLPLLRGTQAYRFLLFLNLALAEAANHKGKATCRITYDGSWLSLSAGPGGGGQGASQPAEWYQTLFFHSSSTMPYSFDGATGMYSVSVLPTHLMPRQSET